jgi:murein L,D-transpeptidase YafK
MRKRSFLLSAFGFILTACTASRSKFKTYNGPEVTDIVVYKGRREMYLMHGEKVLQNYKIDLGFAPEGHKRVEGDGKTPEGLYHIDRRNPNSSFHLSLGISYPDAEDKARAEAMGKQPGGDIFIHGQDKIRSEGDWTFGCIAVKNHEIEDIYAMVKNGTQIFITA